MIRDIFHRPFSDLRISVTDKCNFRCTYCMPAEIYGESYKFLSKPSLLTFKEITRMARLLVGLGAKKIRLTGGEPLIRKNLERLVEMLADVNGVHDLTLTTNGYLLPQKAQLLKTAGLHRITISLDTLNDDIFQKMNGRGFKTHTVLKGIKEAERAGFTPIKINCVVQRGVNDRSIVELARYFKESNHIVRFIEYMDVGNRNGWKLDQVVSAAEIANRIDTDMPIEPIKKSYPGEVATRYRYRDGSGEIGVIASVTKPFCDNCTRLRLSPEGKLYTCLFATKSTDLLKPLRSGATDDEILSIVRNIWNIRVDRYSEERSFLSKPVGKKVEMYHIGG